MKTRPFSNSLDGFHTSPTAQRADELVREFFDTVNSADTTRIDKVLARNALSYDAHGTRSRTGVKRYYDELRRSFSDLHFQVHENIGVLVEDDLVALRTVVSGVHSGDYAGIAATGQLIETSASHIFRVRDGQIVEHWQVIDSYRILVAIGAIPRAANTFQKEILRVAESPGGLFQERLGSEFGTGDAPLISGDESRRIVTRLYERIIATGNADQAEMVADGYVQNSGWTPDGRAAFVSALVISRGAMPDGRALQAHMVAEHNRVASMSVWDGTLTPVAATPSTS
jgi:predicted ester cyclase